jgi:hypothetical protein
MLMESSLADRRQAFDGVLNTLSCSTGSLERVYLFGRELRHRISVEENAKLIGREL